MARYETMLAEETLILVATELVSERLDALDMSRTELAERVGVSKARITHILAGDKNFTIRTYAEIAHALGCSVKIELVPDA